MTDDGKIDGFTKDGDARHGTEAGMLQDFGKDGYSALPDNHELPQTNDQHVKEDGTNMDNVAYAGHKILDGLSSAAQWVGNAINSLPGPFKGLLGPLNMMSKGVSGASNVADTAVTGGDTKQAAKDMGYDVGQSAVTSAVSLVDPTGVAANAAGSEFRNAIDPSGA